MEATSLDKQINDPTRVVAPVDVVAEKDMQRSGDWIVFKMLIYTGEELLGQVRPAMDIADGVDARTLANPRWRAPIEQLREAKPPHDRVLATP